MRNKILKITIIAIFILITIFLPKTLATDMPENETDNTIITLLLMKKNNVFSIDIYDRLKLAKGDS